MNIFQVIKLALGGIMANKLRSILTMLGVIIGVSAVIILVSIGQGATSKVKGQIQGLGSNLISVTITGRGIDKGLSYAEVMSFSVKPGVSGVAPVMAGNITAKFASKKITVSIEGTNEQYGAVRNQSIQKGRFLLPVDILYRQKVLLLGSDTAKRLFGVGNPIGEYIKVNGVRFKVVGVLQEKGAGPFGSSNEKVVIPITTAMRLLSNEDIRTVYLQSENENSVELVKRQLVSFLTKKFKDVDNFRVFNQAEMLSTLNQVTGILTSMLAGIASISLLVGGIGIMNIMLVSVTERTKEIGIRKAIGAKRKNILSQFLIEAIVVSGFGGIIGILFGILVTQLLERLIGIPSAVSPGVILLAFSFSVIVGIFFGLYPANKASKLNPIEALRFE